VFAVVSLASGCGGDSEPATSQPSSLREWEEHRSRLDETVWGDETEAQEYEQTLVALWDALLAADGRADATLSVLSALDFGVLKVGAARRIDEIDHGISRYDFGEPSRELAPGDWTELLQELAGRGYTLVQSEWHHARFSPASAGSAARSIVSVVLHVMEEGPNQRLIVEGEIAIVWSGLRDARGNPIPESIDATRLRLLRRDAAPGFQQILGYTTRHDGEISRIHPVLLHDLDRDGLDDVVLIGARRVLWNLGTRGFRDAPLADRSYLLAEAGLIADLDGDARPDLLSARARGDLVLYRGDERGLFRDEPLVVAFEEPLRGPSALTAGDVDRDGDLDVWLGQYKPPYLGGQMPSPYYDANDGHPAYLLKNDGAGRFTDATEAAGLTEKRFRRTYASSFVDLDDDDDLDLLVVSDFSGIDLYHNDGSGHFVDANDSIRSDRHLFGMSASFADYDLDGRLDFFVAGMASTTARRLEALGLSRADEAEARDMRMRMAFGNRMYLATDTGWSEPEFSADVARTGWTWGTTAFDFDNDGDPDIFAANGHQSGESTQDYCANFWTHDIFDGDSTPNESLASLFDQTTAGFAEGRESWDGYQKNHLLMNRGGLGFTNVAFLLGVADEFDGRSAVSGDLDRDGRVDLVVVESLGDEREKLHIYRNQLDTGHHWIGVELREEGGGLSPVGAKVVVHTADRDYVGRVMTGETLMGQHSTTLHFGLGTETEVEAIEVHWVSGDSRRVRDPAIDRYHRIRGRELASTDRASAE
jgi:hypothetical protein